MLKHLNRRGISFGLASLLFWLVGSSCAEGSTAGYYSAIAKIESGGRVRYYEINKLNRAFDEYPSQLLESNFIWKGASANQWFQWGDSLKKRTILRIMGESNRRDINLVSLNEAATKAALVAKMSSDSRSHFYVLDLIEEKIEYINTYEKPIEGLCWMSSEEIAVLFAEKKTSYTGLGVFKAIAGHPVPLSKYFYGMLNIKKPNELEVKGLTREYEEYSTGYLRCN